MKVYRASIFLLMILFSPSLLVAQLEGNAVTDIVGDNELPHPEKVIERAILAAGGYEVLGSESSSHWKSIGKSERGEEFGYEYYRAKGKFYSKFTYESGRVIERGVVSDGSLTT